jgi:hypothetical protein
MAKQRGSVTDPLWLKDALIYELHVRAFKDSNADGIGDFPGLMQELDYLQDLCLTCLWLLPFFPSPLKDDGYDISDYLGVHPIYGTRDDIILIEMLGYVEFPIIGIEPHRLTLSPTAPSGSSCNPSCKRPPWM